MWIFCISLADIFIPSFWLSMEQGRLFANGCFALRVLAVHNCIQEIEYRLAWGPETYFHRWSTSEAHVSLVEMLQWARIALEVRRSETHVRSPWLNVPRTFHPRIKCPSLGWHVPPPPSNFFSAVSKRYMLATEGATRLASNITIQGCRALFQQYII